VHPAVLALWPAPTGPSSRGGLYEMAEIGRTERKDTAYSAGQGMDLPELDGDLAVSVVPRLLDVPMAGLYPVSMGEANDLLVLLEA
jgi:hypothetical protein